MPRTRATVPIFKLAPQKMPPSHSSMPGRRLGQKLDPTGPCRALHKRQKAMIEHPGVMQYSPCCISTVSDRKGLSDGSLLIAKTLHNRFTMRFFLYMKEKESTASSVQCHIHVSVATERTKLASTPGKGDSGVCQLDRTSTNFCCLCWYEQLCRGVALVQMGSQQTSTFTSPKPVDTQPVHCSLETQVHAPQVIGSFSRDRQQNWKPDGAPSGTLNHKVSLTQFPRIPEEQSCKRSYSVPCHGIGWRSSSTSPTPHPSPKPALHTPPKPHSPSCSLHRTSTSAQPDVFRFMVTSLDGM